MDVKNFSSLGFGLYFGVVGAALRSVLSDGFSLSFATAFSLAVLISSVTAYPLFLRGGAMRQGFMIIKGERWQFANWLIYCVAVSAFIFAVATALGISE